MFGIKNQSKLRQEEVKWTFVCVFILPVLVEFRPDIVFIKNIIMNVLGHGVKHFREPGKAEVLILNRNRKKHR